MYLFIYIFKNFLINLFSTNLVICLLIHFFNYFDYLFFGPPAVAGIFFKKNLFAPKMENMGQKWVKDRVFWIYWKIWSIYFSEFGLWRNFIITAVFLHKSHTFEKSGSWDMGQNALDQSECSIDYFKLTIYLEQNDEKAWFLACWCRLIEIKSWLKNIGVGVVKNGCDHSGLRTLKLVVSQEGINGISWLLVCW